MTEDQLLEKHIQRCRDAVAECPNWSPAQAEWSRARDALLNFRDDLLELRAPRRCRRCVEAGMTSASPPGALLPDERGDMRMIFADAECVATPSMQREMGGDIWAHIGPIGQFTSHPELQDALGLVIMAFNRRHGRLSAEKQAELVKGHEAGAELVREALSDVPQEDQVERLREALERISRGEVDWQHKPAEEMRDIANAALRSSGIDGGE